MGGNYENLSREQIYEFNLENIPDELRDKKFWIPWVAKKDKTGKVTKVPINFERHSIDAFQPDNWHQLDEVLEYREKNLCGVALVLAPELDIIALDYDNAISDGTIRPEVFAYLTSLETYYEISPSRQGIRGFAWTNGVKIKEIDDFKHTTNITNDINLELWASNDSSKAMRWVTVTGIITDEFKGIGTKKISNVSDAFLKNIAPEVETHTKGKTKKKKVLNDDKELPSDVRNNISQALDENDFWGVDSEEGTGKHHHHDLAYGLAGLLAKQGIDRNQVVEFIQKYNKQHPTGAGKKIHDQEDLKKQVLRAYEMYETGELKIPSLITPELKRQINWALIGVGGIHHKFDGTNAAFLSDGNFYSLYLDTNNGGQWKSKLLFHAEGLEIIKLMKQDSMWKFTYNFAGRERTDTIDELVQHLSGKLHTAQLSNQKFSEFLYVHQQTLIEKEEFEVMRESIWVDEKGIIHVDNDGNEVKDSLTKIMEIYKVVTHPQAFMRSFLYHVLSPFSFEIRSVAKKFPYRILWGKTHGGKTVMESLFVFKGFGQDPNKRKETMQTVKTIITFGQAIEKTRFPLIIDDVSNSWLKTNAEGLKGATDSVKFISRGTRSLDQRSFQMWGMPSMTMNAEPAILQALKDRFIADEYGENETGKQNVKQWNILTDSMKNEFMLPIIKEALEGKTIKSLIENIHYQVKADAEINNRVIEYAFELIRDIAKKYKIEFIDEAPVYEEEQRSNNEESFYDYIAIRRVSKDVDQSLDKKMEYRPEEKAYYVTQMLFEDWQNYMRVKERMSMVDFANECARVSKDGRKTVYPTQSKWVKALKKNAKILIIPSEFIEEIKEIADVQQKQYLSRECVKEDHQSCSENDCECVHHLNDKMRDAFGI